MKKFIYSLISVILLTFLWVGLFQLVNCYPEHGGDEFTSFFRSISYIFWKIQGFIIVMLLGIGVLSASLQGYSFNALIEKIKPLKAHLLSTLIPIIFSIIVIMYALWFKEKDPGELSVEKIYKFTLSMIALGQMINSFVYVYRKNQDNK